MDRKKKSGGTNQKVVKNAEKAWDKFNLIMDLEGND